MHVVFGIGNPGPEYEATRHNLGFMVVDALAARAGAALAPLPGVRADGATVRWRGRDLLLVKPMTYVNRCGPVLAAIRDRLTLPLARLLVVVDDLNLPLGRLRLRQTGSDGGHNGLRSLLAHLGDDRFPRLRIGIGDPGGRPAERFVLERFPVEERPQVEAAVEASVGALGTWLEEGIERAMEAANRRDLDRPEDPA